MLRDKTGKEIKSLKDARRLFRGIDAMLSWQDLNDLEDRDE